MKESRAGLASYVLRHTIRAVGFVARHFLPRGRVRLARLIMRYAPEHEMTYRDRWGYRRIALLSDEMEAYGFTGVPVLPDYVARYIKPGDWVVDVGANVGRATAQLCHLTGPGGLVWAIEPVPRNLSRLRYLKEQNNLRQLVIFEGALASRSGTASLRLPVEANSGHASFTRSWGVAGLITVSTWSLDDLTCKMRDKHNRSMAFLKIDVEGYEPQVLTGAKRTLEEMRPLVLCEFNDILLRDAGSSSQQLLNMFEALGYSPVTEPPPLEGKVVDLLLAAR